MRRKGFTGVMATWKDARRWAWSVCAVIFVLEMVCGEVTRSEGFSEELVLRPLPDGKVLSHFLFKNQLRTGSEDDHHHKLFPKAIYQLVQKFRIREMELSFTQGRWDHQRWGGLDSIASAEAKPEGVELWAQFHNSDREADSLWRNLTHALSGLFCASINFLESSSMVSKPGWMPRGDHRGMDGQPTISEEESSRAVRHGALPREAVCTENLTPWLKLLPCRDRAGLSTLLERPRIHNGNYYSLRVNVRAGDRHGVSLGSIALYQSLTLVLKPPKVEMKPGSRGLISTVGLQQRPHWSLSSLFGKTLLGMCPLASSSRVHLELENTLVEELKASEVGKDPVKSRNIDGAGDECTHPNKLEQAGERASLGFSNLDIIRNDIFNLNTAPDSVSKHGYGSLLLNYEIQKLSKSFPLNVGMSWLTPVTWSPCKGPFRATQFLTGRGNGRGSILSLVNANTDSYSSSCCRSVNEDSQLCLLAGDDGLPMIHVTIFQMVPWYVRLYMHTLKVVVDGKQVGLRDSVKLKLSPADDRRAPAVLEMSLSMPRNTSMLFLSVDFDKGFLRIDEHPPDANRGFDLPSALFTFSRSEIAGSHNEWLQPIPSSPMQIYPDNLLVPLATPDFSMPYNVITFTMTSLALYFGSLLNALRLRTGRRDEPQQPPARLASRLQKIFAIFIRKKNVKAA